jgi:hypothetical protein
MAKKEFKKGLMHSTRRKLAEMVKTGVYDAPTTIGWTPKNDTHERKIGDVWEDEYHRYEKKAGYILKTSKQSDVLSEVRNWLKDIKKCKSGKCQTKKISKKDEKLIAKTGYCINCLAEIETKIRLAGIWEEYKQYRIYTRMIVVGRTKIEELREAHDTAKQTYETVLESGEAEVWTLPKPVDEVKAEMKEIIEKWDAELNEVIEKRNAVFDTIRKAGFEQYL